MNMYICDKFFGFTLFNLPKIALKMAEREKVRKIVCSLNIGRKNTCG